MITEIHESLIRRQVNTVSSTSIYEYPMSITRESGEIRDESVTISEGDKKFIAQRDLILQEITVTMDSILNGLNELNISLESSIAVGKEFESVADLWKTFYDGLESVTEREENELDDEVKEK
ncbi:hypothetical protein NCAS_0A10380 [Naumovozyma castellii]|uniref:DASH complex subunit DAD1 n=1 Tax=Naumovozyma castellii TaxID=27288 RepID=G0V7Z8_NAUCA|nr:hypothetical protein NCAS_0A10380 [Naumovozyma castellii CBS 4309]CCC67596.1 hypothetical protein NCAS_0A10380 [Naumovozyma castellii CBS 4309]